MIDIQTVNLLDILPANLRNDPSLQAAALAIQHELQVTTAAIYKLSIWDRLDDLNNDETDEMAWQLHVDFYDTTLPVEQKRQLVKNAIRFHRRKGTPAAVEELVATIFGSGKVVEWFEYDGDPGYFKVTTDDPTATNERAQEFISAINSVKNTRSWLEAIEISKNDDMQLYFGFPVQIGATYTCEQVV